MTIISWDGKTLVADTRLSQLDEDGKVIDRDDDFVKIFNGARILFNSRPVQALAFAGSAALALQLIERLQTGWARNQGESVEMLTPDNYNGIEVTEEILRYGPAVLLVVADDQVGTISYSVVDGRLHLQFLYYPRECKLFVGSGYDVLVKKYPLLLLGRLQARAVVFLACRHDPMSGGRSLCWNSETGEMNYRGIKAKGVKQRLGLVVLLGMLKVISLALRKQDKEYRKLQEEATAKFLAPQS